MVPVSIACTNGYIEDTIIKAIKGFFFNNYFFWSLLVDMQFLQRRLYECFLFNFFNFTTQPNSVQ